MSKKIQINGANWENNSIPNWYIKDCDTVINNFSPNSIAEAGSSISGFSCKYAIDGLKVNTFKFIPKTAGKISIYILPSLQSQDYTKVATIVIDSTEVENAVTKKVNTFTVPNGGWIMLGTQDVDEASDNTLSWYYTTATGLGFYVELGTGTPRKVNNQCIGFNIGYFPD